MDKIIIKSLTLLFFSIPIISLSSDSSWLDDYKKNKGVFTSEKHYVYPGSATRSSGFVITSLDDLFYKTVGLTRKPLAWSDIQPKLVDSSTPQAVAMAGYKKYAYLLSQFMIFHLFAVPKVLVDFPEEDKKMILAKWGFTDSTPADGDYVELVYSTETKYGALLKQYKITAKHKKIAELGSLTAYLNHKGFNFSRPDTVEFIFDNELDFGSRSDKIMLFNYVFNFLANDYRYRLSNNFPVSEFSNVSATVNGTTKNCKDYSSFSSAEKGAFYSACRTRLDENISTYQSDWSRIYSYTLGKHSPQFARADVIAGHKNYKKTLTQNSAIHKFSFNKDGGVGGADIDGESFYVLADLLIPKSDLEWRTAIVTIHRANTYHKHKRKFVGGKFKTLKTDPMTGDEAFMYLKAKLQSRDFKDLSEGGSSDGLAEHSDPEETAQIEDEKNRQSSKKYTFTFSKQGGMGGTHFDHKFHADIKGLYVLYSDIKDVHGQWATFKITFHSNLFYYKADVKKGWDARGQKLTGAQAYNYLVENVPTDPDTPPYLYRQKAGDNPKIPNVEQPEEDKKAEKAKKEVSVYKIAFKDNYNEFNKSVTVDGEEFYVSRDILIPYKSWGWNGLKIVLTINKADTFHRAIMKWRGSGTQYMYYVKGDKMTGEAVFKTFRDHFTHFGFEDLTEY